MSASWLTDGGGPAGRSGDMQGRSFRCSRLDLGLFTTADQLRDTHG